MLASPAPRLRFFTLHPYCAPPTRLPAAGLAAAAALHSLVLEVLAFVASRYPALYAPRRRWLITLAIAHLSATIHLLSEPQLHMLRTWLAGVARSIAGQGRLLGFSIAS